MSSAQQLCTGSITTLLDVALKNRFYFASARAADGARRARRARLVNAPLNRFRTFFRTAYFVPFVTTLVAVAIVWRYLYHPTTGCLTTRSAVFGIAPVNW